MPRSIRRAVTRKRHAFERLDETSDNAFLLSSNRTTVTLTLPELAVPVGTRIRCYQLVEWEERFTRVVGPILNDQWQVVGWRTVRGIKRHTVNSGRWLPVGRPRRRHVFQYSVVTDEGESLPRAVTPSIF